MKKDYEVTQMDYWKFSLFNTMRSWKSKFSLVLIALLVPLVMFGFGMALTIDQTTCITIALVVGVLADGFIYFFIRRKIMALPKEVGGIIGKRCIEFVDDGIITKTEKDKLFLKYSAVKRLGENSEYIFIYVNDYMAEILPKRVFSSDLELNEFKKILINKTDLVINSKGRV